MSLLSLLVVTLSVTVLTAFILIAVQYFPVGKVKRAHAVQHK